MPVLLLFPMKFEKKNLEIALTPDFNNIHNYFYAFFK